MSLLKRLFSASGPLIRVLIGAGSVALLILGLRHRGKGGDGPGVRGVTLGSKRPDGKG